MKEKKMITLLSVIVVACVWFNAGMGLFYSDGGSPRFVESIYGETVQLFGDGVYANDSMFHATIQKGSDLVILLVSVGFLITTLKRNAGQKMKLVHSGLLVSILYYSATKAFETIYNRMFLLYLFMFSAAFFAFVVTMIDLSDTIRPVKKDENHTKTAIFTMLSGCTALVWLMDILPSLFAGTPLGFITIYTTSPTLIIDIGLIFPTCITSGIMLLRNKPMGYIIPPIILTFVAVIAVTVIGQTILQLRYGVVISMQELIGYVVTFVAFGFIAVIVNTRFMLRCWPKSK